MGVLVKCCAIFDMDGLCRNASDINIEWLYGLVKWPYNMRTRMGIQTTRPPLNTTIVVWAVAPATTNNDPFDLVFKAKA